MEILDLRHFTSADLRHLLDEESDIWLELLSWDYRGSAEMILRYIDAKILPGYAAVERGRILGYSFFVYEASKGVIGDIFVESDQGERREIIERQLLKHVIDTLQQSPGVHRVEAQLLLHETGAASWAFLEERFKGYQRLFMCRPLKKNEPSPVEDLRSDVTIRAWQESDYQPTAGIITAAYKLHIDSEINDQYRTITGSLRFLNNIVRFPGCGVFDPRCSFVAVHQQTKAQIGVILCSRVRRDVGHITQVCVLPEYRNGKIGEHLIAATRNTLASSGGTELTLTVTEINTKAVALYKRLGFEAKRVFDAFVWEG